ncbi:MAG: TolC [uncultured bacterium]|nr:MAG: TolC [uncultured bacterium]
MKMSSLMKVCSLTLPLVFCASIGYAIDLAGMQSLALNNRQVIQQYLTSLEQSEQDIIRARGGYYPAVDVSYTANELDDDSLLETKENSVAVGKVSWNVFAGFRDRYGLQSAELRSEVERFKLQGIKQDVQLNVALAYLEVFERRANLKVALSAFETLGKIYRDGESRYQVGLIGKNELLKFRVDYDNADITAKSAEASLKKGVNALSRQVGGEIDPGDLDFADFKGLPPLVNREEYSARMLAGRSEIKAVELGVDAAAAQAEAEKGGYYPRVDVVGSYRKYDDDLVNGNGTIDEEEARAQLVMSMNLFQGHTTEGAVAKTKLQSRSLQHELAELKSTLQTDLNNLYIDFQVSLENVEVATRSIEQAEENLRITQLKYDEGLQRESDLLDAITSLSRAQYNHVAVVRTAFANNFRLTRMIDGF